MSDDQSAKNDTATETDAAAKPATETAADKGNTGRRFWKGFNKTAKTVLIGAAVFAGLVILAVAAPKVLLIGARLLLPLVVLGAAVTGAVALGNRLFSSKKESASQEKIDESRIQSIRSAGPDNSPKLSTSPKDGFNATGAKNDDADSSNENKAAPQNGNTTQTAQNRLKK